jgi:DNA-binding HxlR family transcriptional regulator
VFIPMIAHTCPLARAAVDFVARIECVDALADVDDDTGHIHVQRGGQLWIQSDVRRAQQEIDGIEARRPDIDQHVPRRDLGPVHLHLVEGCVLTILVHSKCLHASPPSLSNGEYRCTLEFDKYARFCTVGTKKEPMANSNKNCREPFGCSVEATLSVVGGRWKPVIIFQLLENDVLRFGEMKRKIPAVTQRMLTNQLRELERDGVVLRKVYAEVPPRVEYSLTRYGRTLEPVMLAMRDWGATHMTTLANRK